MPRRKYAIISWYLPPGSDDISEDILGHIENRGDFILVGDLNARLPMYDTPSNSRGRALEKTIN